MSSSFMVQYQKDQVILHQGEKQKCVYKIISGTVAFYTNYGKINRMRAGERSAPDYFGEIMLLADQPSYCTMVAESPVTALQVSEEDFTNFLRKNAQNGIYMVQTMAENLRMVHININKTQLLSQIEQAAAQAALDLGILRGLVQPEVSARLEAHFGQEDAEKAQKKEECSYALLPGHPGYVQVPLPDCTQFLYEKEYTCPHCGQVFQGVRIATLKLTPIHDAIGKERYDFRMIYENFRSEWFEIVSCPHCYFSAFADLFQSHEPPRKEYYTKKLAEARAKVPGDFLQKRTMEDVFIQHYLAMLCADAYQNNLMNKAQLWQNIAWLYEDRQETAMMEEAMERTMEAYEEVYSVCELSSAQMQRIFLVIAGILHHKGEEMAARRWLMEVKQLRDGKPIYTNMADRLIQLIREKMDLAE